MKTVLLITILLVLMGPAIGQNETDPFIDEIRLTLSDVGPGFEAFEDSVDRLGARGTANLLIYQRRYFSAQPPFGDPENLYEMSIWVGHYGTDNEIRKAWWDASQTNGSHLTIKPEEFDLGRTDFVARGDYPSGLFRVCMDRVIAQVRVPKYSTETDEQHRARVNHLLVQLFENIDQLNEDSIPPFLFDFQTDQASGNLAFTLTPLQELTFGAEVNYTVWNEAGPRDKVLDVELDASPSGEFTAVIDTSALAVGSYTLTVSAWDNYLARVVSYQLPFEVSLGNDADIVLYPHQDTILSLRSQHQNDGANALLTLEKIQGKATRNAVAFDLANINLNGLSQATLILNVDSSEHVNGWGNGRTISAQAIATPWLEGNGMNFGLKKKDQVSGNGSGATWFSPIDDDISNDSSNSAVNWNGAGVAINPPTAAAVTISNGLSGEVSFDVTGDVLNGADNGWLILKDQENVGSKISFYSREGAAAAGDPDLAPRLILEFGEVASSEPDSESLLAHVGLGAIDTKLRLTGNESEVRSTKEILQENPVAALAAEQLLSEATRSNPLLNLTARIAYRSWLADSVQIAAAPFWAA